MPLRTHKQWWGVTLDAPNARELARFYAKLLDWRLFENDGAEGAAVAPSETVGFSLEFQSEPLYARPVWPAEAGKPQMAMHLEIEVDDLDEAVAYAVPRRRRGGSLSATEHCPSDARSSRSSLLFVPE